MKGIAVRTMKLYLIQHAEAKREEEDPSRPLTESGAGDAERVADLLNQMSIKIDRVLHSGKTRSLQTAEILARKLRARAERSDALEPLADVDIWVTRLEKMDKDLMLVGHMPHLGKLCSRLLTRAGGLNVGFKPGSVVCLQREAEGWTLVWMITPNLIQKM
jgi:phosphohistidine phosphatase